MSRIRYINGYNEPVEETREEFHTENEPLLTAYNTPDDAAGVTDKIHIPLERVVSIKEPQQ